MSALIESKSKKSENNLDNTKIKMIIKSFN